MPFSPHQPAIARTRAFLPKTGSTRDEAISGEDGENVVTVGALLFRFVDLPAVVEVEYLP
jgi:hypothetical protein